MFVNSSFSKERYINSGVPQGSVLGPLLFLIYVNDIADSLNSITRLFADDSSLAVSSKDNLYIQEIINRDLDNINKWAKQWLVKFNPAKTDVMFFTLNKNTHVRPSIFFQNTQLNYVQTHKHLGVTLSEDGTWHQHITNIAASASKVLGTMRLLKFKLKRKTLNQIYISYLRPIIEYASIVWDNCTNYEKDLLEKIQYDAARIVTGLTRSVHLNNLLKEIGWVSLADRRKMQKLILVFKHTNNLLPNYLNNIFPDIVLNSNPYLLRNNLDYATVARRLQIYSTSVIPSSVKIWNELDQDIRESDSLSTFKFKLKKIYKAHAVPSFFLEGDRFLQVQHARLRNKCSNLNADLFNNHLRDDSKCNCGCHTEDPEHFLFQCKLYSEQRRTLFINTRQFHPLSVCKLLFGIDTISGENNSLLFKNVQNYIKNTRRFAQ